MSRISFQEKMLWAQLVGIVVVVVFYGHFLVHSGPGHHYFHALLLVLLFLFASVRTFFRRRSGSVVKTSVTGLCRNWIALEQHHSRARFVVILVLYWDHGSMRSANFLLIDILFHLLVLAGSAAYCPRTCRLPDGSVSSCLRNPYESSAPRAR